MKAVCQQYYRARNNHRSPLLVSSLGLGHFWPNVQFPPRCGFSQKGRDGVRRTSPEKRSPRPPSGSGPPPRGAASAPIQQHRRRSVAQGGRAAAPALCRSGRLDGRGGRAGAPAAARRTARRRTGARRRIVAARVAGGAAIISIGHRLKKYLLKTFLLDNQKLAIRPDFT
jgi:hypothetical protein